MIDGGFEWALAKMKMPERGISMVANFRQAGIPRVNMVAA
jgi:hypothetical protein